MEKHELARALRVFSFLAAPPGAWFDALFFSALVCAVMGAAVDFLWKLVLGFELYAIQQAYAPVLTVGWLLIALAVLAKRPKMGDEAWRKSFAILRLSDDGTDKPGK
ncbi:hypothetical protein [Caballeronia sp. BCC1704]|uniref:hypothetical protein n=1 Tax=Caballeronia sp. BCC1704 TaxID=2676300 RepID=UPI00158C5112|nr:hypothetical protein [Caballeronia sp. BCC1704]